MGYRFLHFSGIRATLIGVQTTGLEWTKARQSRRMMTTSNGRRMLKTRSSSNILSHNLGELELRVLEALWQRPHLDARQVREALCAETPQRRTPGLSTIQSTLEQGLYRPHKTGACVYLSRLSVAR